MKDLASEREKPLVQEPARGEGVSPLRPVGILPARTFRNAAAGGSYDRRRCAVHTLQDGEMPLLQDWRGPSAPVQSISEWTPV